MSDNKARRVNRHR